MPDEICDRGIRAASCGASGECFRFLLDTIFCDSGSRGGLFGRGIVAGEAGREQGGYRSGGAGEIAERVTCQCIHASPVACRSGDCFSQNSEKRAGTT